MCTKCEQNKYRINVQNYLETKHSQFFNKRNFVAINNGKSIHEIEMKAENNERKWIELSNNTIEYNGQQAILSIIRDITERKNLEYKIMEAIIRTQEEDQTRYAQELHDGLGPILSTLKMYVEWIMDKNNTANKEKIMEQTIYSINEAISPIKRNCKQSQPSCTAAFWFN